MKKLIKYLLPVVLLVMGTQVQAQWYNDGAVTNPGGLVSDWTGQGINTATGSYSTAGSTGAPDMYGVFEHKGQTGTGANSALVNNGTYDASVNGRDYFLGPSGTAGQQGIGGISAPTFGELFLQNGAGQLFDITNSNGANVATNASFDNGVTTTVRANTQAGALRFQAGATYTGGLTDAQHVNGYVSKIGNTAFVFPVGTTNDSRTLSMAAPVNADAHISVAYDLNLSEGTSAVAAPINRVFTGGSWDWVPVVANTNALSVTASIPNVAGFEATASNLRLVGWNGSQWVDLSGSANASGVAENSTLTGTVPAGSTITQIGIGSIAGPAPDLTPNITVLPSALIGATSLTLNIKVIEIHAVATTGSLITVNVRSSANWTIGLTPGTVVSGWTYVGLVGVNHRFTSNLILNNSTAEFNIPATFDPNGATGDYVFTVGILSGSGGETNGTNNGDQETVSYEP